MKNKQELKSKLKEIKFKTTITLQKTNYTRDWSIKGEIIEEDYEVEKDIEYSLLDYACFVYQYSDNEIIEEVCATILYLYQNNVLCEDNFTDNQDFVDFLKEEYGD